MPSIGELMITCVRSVLRRGETGLFLLDALLARQDLLLVGLEVGFADLELVLRALELLACGQPFFPELLLPREVLL